MSIYNKKPNDKYIGTVGQNSILKEAIYKILDESGVRALIRVYGVGLNKYEVKIHNNGIVYKRIQFRKNKIIKVEERIIQEIKKDSALMI